MFGASCEISHAIANIFSSPLAKILKKVIFRGKSCVELNQFLFCAEFNGIQELNSVTCVCTAFQ
jgi:hypothetical protein